MTCAFETIYLNIIMLSSIRIAFQWILFRASAEVNLDYLDLINIFYSFTVIWE